MKKYMKRKSIGNWEQWTQKQLKKYIVARIRKILKNKGISVKPYRIYNKRMLLERIFKAHSGPKFLQYKPVIRLTVNAIAREYYESHDVAHRHANTVGITTVRAMASEMFNSGDEKAFWSGLILLLTHFTGCRAKEALRLQWSDWNKTKNENGKFWTFKIRTSKSNMIPLRNEQITIKLGPSRRELVKQFIVHYRKSGKPSKGYIFDQKWGTTANVNYQLKKFSRTEKIDPPLSAHSGRNFVLKQMILAGIEESSIKTFMRWTDNSQMLQHYKNTTLECTAKGAAFRLHEFNF